MNSHQYRTQHTRSQYSKALNPIRTGTEKSMSRARECGALSRASLVHGSVPSSADSWFDVEAFLLDQVREVLNKLSDGSIDDEIWGKIVVMERCKRVAKAYLRKTTVIVDGSEEEFDGKTLGFNMFDNPERDETTAEIRSKISDGVILKMDLQGNVKGMARGCAPVICQGWRGFHSSVSDRLARQQGRLNGPCVDQEKPFKLFDMKKFKHSLDHELHEIKPDVKSLMLKTCIRVALVKDGIEMSRTPCWFAVVNLVALDMLKERFPTWLKQVSSEYKPAALVSKGNTLMSSAISQEALQQIIAAAVSQVNQGLSKSMHSLPTEAQEQLTQQIASTLNINNNISNNNNNNSINNNMKNETINPASVKKMEQTTIMQRRERKKTYHSSTSSLDSSADETVGARAIDPTQVKSARLKRWEPTACKSIPPDEFYDSGFDKTKEKEKEKPLRTFPTPARPRLQDVFTRSQSITSDYDSNKELFDSGSWSSSHSRGFPGGRSTSSSIVSEPELVMINRNQPIAEPWSKIKEEEDSWTGQTNLQRKHSYRNREEEVTTTIRITPHDSPNHHATNQHNECTYPPQTNQQTPMENAYGSSLGNLSQIRDETPSRHSSVSRTSSIAGSHNTSSSRNHADARSRANSPNRIPIGIKQERSFVGSRLAQRTESFAQSELSYRRLPLKIRPDHRERKPRIVTSTVIYDEPYDEYEDNTNMRVREQRKERHSNKGTVSYRNTIGYKAFGTVPNRKGCADFDLSLLNGKEPTYRSNNEEMQFYTRSGQTMEAPSNGSRGHTFYNELKQVLHQRTSAVRLPRNHSQPAQYRPNQSNQGTYGPSRGLRRTPALRHTPSTPQGIATGNSRTLGEYGREAQSRYGEAQSRPQSSQQHQYPVYHKYPTTVKVARTASLPFGQWECNGPQSQLGKREARRVGM